MTYAYDKNMVRYTQSNFGGMFDFAVYGFGYRLSDFYHAFLNSEYAYKVEIGDSRTIMGRSGIELFYEITGKDFMPEAEFERYEVHSINGRSREYWTGWALAYYQWKSGLSFRQIEDILCIDDISSMYYKYHEMDIEQFVDRMNELKEMRWSESALKRIRKYAQMTQKELSEKSGIPLKTIQQYEQGQKDIRNAHASSLVILSKILRCSAEELLEVK